MYILYVSVVLAVCLAQVSAVDNTKCDADVIQCLKDVNGGEFPLNFFTGLEVLWNRRYSIVWYSKSQVEALNLTCINTKFSLFGNTDTYWNGCSDKEDITFNTSFNSTDKTFTISNYQGLTMKAYAAYHKDTCLSLYVCSPEGVTESHVTIYCPTKKVSKLSEQIEEAKSKLTQCNINDGTALCTESCDDS